MMQAYQAENGVPIESKIYLRRRLADEVESPNFSLPIERRLPPLAEAQSLALQIEDSDLQWESLIKIAREYVAIGEVDLARQMSSMMADRFAQESRSADNWEYDSYHERSVEYSEFLISIGEQTQAIALANEIENPEDYSGHLSNEQPAQFVAVGKYELAEEMRTALPTSRRRLLAGLDMVKQYQLLDLLDEAFALTKRLLDEAQYGDLTSEIGTRGFNQASMGAELLGSERINRVGQVIQLYYNRSHISPEILSQDEVREIGIELAGTTDSNWLRSEVIEKELSIHDAISTFERDDELDVPDSLLLFRAILSVRDNEFDLAVSNVERMRSPYVKTLSLTHIATRYLSAL